MKLSWIRIIIILMALIIGITAHIIERDPNGFLEQAAELILRLQGVHVDFSTEDAKESNHARHKKMD